VIVVDTSALMAILKGELESEACIDVLANETRVLISAGTVAEALIVSSARHIGDEMTELLGRFGCETISVTGASARKVAEAHARWGKSRHPAGLNFGDCFAYALAEEESCPLLFVGRDFAATDVSSALAKP
jgi:ribonuclease VapC